MRPVLFPISLVLLLALSGPVRAKVGMYLGPDVLGEFGDVHHIKKDKSKVKYKWESGGCKYEYKADRKGVKEKYKCK